MAKRSTTKTRARRAAPAQSSTAIVRYEPPRRYSPPPPPQQSLVVVSGRGGMSRRGGRRRGSGGGDISVGKAVIGGGIVGAGLVFALRTQKGKEVSSSKFVQEHGVGPYTAAAGYAVYRWAPQKYKKYGKLAIAVGAALAVSNYMNKNATAEQGTVTVAGDRRRRAAPNLEDIQSRLSDDE